MATDLNTDKKQKSVFTKWLEKLQQESWQLELLISGFAIFGIFQSRTIITDLSFAKNSYLEDSSVWLSMFVFVIKKGWLIFFVNLLIHVVLRSLWIGAIGLRYVSAEINYDRFQYSDIFSRFLKNSVGTYDDFIERLEKVCSVIFAYTFLLFLLFMSLMLFAMQSVFFGLMIQKINPASDSLLALSGIFMIFYWMMGALVFFDLISLGGFKRIKNKLFSKAYFFLYRYVGFMTLSFLYRPLLYNFIDHPYTKKLFYFSIPYILIVGFGQTMFQNVSNPFKPESDYLLSTGQVLNENYYDDLRITRLNEFPNEERKLNKRFLGWVSMEQYEISKSLSSIFIALDKDFLRVLEKDTSVTPYFKSGYVFTWFNFHKKSDPDVDSIQKLKSAKINGLFKLKRQKSREFAKSKDEKLKKTIDSLQTAIKNTEGYFDEITRKLKLENVKKIKAAYLKNISFFIDTVPLPMQDIYFFNHPHFGEEGLKCFFSTDSLSGGLHELKVIRNFIKRNQSVEKDSLILPFIKL
ncbi:MAG: hypothetical protein IPG18_06810 [Saprospiraceae bacterium]|nr:hypothetical protein [Saprospiraceae bacterium]